MSSFDLETYLHRIGLTTPPPPTLEGLRVLQRAQMSSLPFENIGPLTGHMPDITEAGIWSKLIEGGRGGYCLELNGLMARALPALGFHCQAVLGRVRLGAERGGWRSHYIHLVRLEGREWLVDTGFGGYTPQGPVDLSDPGAQPIGDGTYRLRPDPMTHALVLERRDPEVEGGWFSLYDFDRGMVTPPDLDGVNMICTHPAHPLFPHHLAMAITLPQGRATLLDRAYKRTIDGVADARELESAEDLGGVLREVFRLRVEDALVETVWGRVLVAGELGR